MGRARDRAKDAERGAPVVRKLIVVIVVLGIIGAVAAWFLTAPRTFAASEIPDHKPDLRNGEYMFWAGGCDACHATPGAKGDDLLKLGGGLVLETQFGGFHVPNISPDRATGIGDWTTLDFINAMKYGIGRDGRHLYPAFPYTSYQRMRFEDLIDLKAYLDTLPPVKNVVPAHDLAFPFNIRRGLGLWQLLYVDGKTFVPDPKQSDEINRGAYLVEAPGHCTQCHSPRNFYGGIIAELAYSGAPSPAGQGVIPNITAHESGLGKWSVEDIVALFKTGFKPSFDVVGGEMAAIQRNLARLTPEDQKAIAEYLKTLPPIASTVKPPPQPAPAS